MATTNLSHYLFTEIADPRVKEWPFLSDPWKLVGVIFLYLYLTYYYLPSYMENRKPFSLQNILMGYNIFQVIACSIIIYGTATSGWTTHYTLGCQLVDVSENKMALRMANFMWWHMLLKMTELIETIFFSLRKKFNQISFLHVYHHISTLIMGWIVAKYYPGGMVSFTVLINSSVHILMYTYYFFSSFGPKMQKRLVWLKPKLTFIQMTQLLIIFLHSSQVFSKSCLINNSMGYIYLPNITINLVLFAKFYLHTYLKKKDKIH